jgi:hypothetical protein
MFTFIKNLFCNHDFEISYHFEIPSEYDIMVSNGKTPFPYHSLTRTYITDYKCTKCGKIKTSIRRTSNL